MAHTRFRVIIVAVKIRVPPSSQLVVLCVEKIIRTRATKDAPETQRTIISKDEDTRVKSTKL